MWVVVVLCLALAVLLLMLLLCCLCPGCYLHGRRQKNVDRPELVTYHGNNGGISSQLTSPSGRKEAWSGRSKRTSVIQAGQRGPISVSGSGPVPVRARRSGYFQVRERSINGNIKNEISPLEATEACN